mmetsp:Transcript_43271/g.134591  ORF Transcript_43271/g.134591 Transcript_43271/m.134591 type:complete len:209 (+) Transcript_43271:557-1183(+)
MSWRSPQPMRPVSTPAKSSTPSSSSKSWSRTALQRGARSRMPGRPPLLTWRRPCAPGASRNWSRRLRRPRVPAWARRASEPRWRRLGREPRRSGERRTAAPAPTSTRACDPRRPSTPVRAGPTPREWPAPLLAKPPAYLYACARARARACIQVGRRLCQEGSGPLTRRWPRTEWRGWPGVTSTGARRRRCCGPSLSAPARLSSERGQS